MCVCVYIYTHYIFLFFLLYATVPKVCMCIRLCAHILIMTFSEIVLLKTDITKWQSNSISFELMQFTMFLLQFTFFIMLFIKYQDCSFDGSFEWVCICLLCFEANCESFLSFIYVLYSVWMYMYPLHKIYSPLVRSRLIWKHRHVDFSFKTVQNIKKRQQRESKEIWDI